MEARRNISPAQRRSRARWGLITLIFLLSALSASAVQVARYLEVALARQSLISNQMRAISRLQGAALLLTQTPLASYPPRSRVVLNAVTVLRRGLASVPSANLPAALAFHVDRAADLIHAIAHPTIDSHASDTRRRTHELLMEISTINVQLRRAAAALQDKAVKAISDARRWGIVFALMLLITLAAFLIRILAQAASQRYAAKNLAIELQRDPLTGWANRALFIDAVDRGLAQAVRAGRHAGILFLDLDRFKIINDRFGHAVGDEVLRQITRRFSAVIRSEDMPARVGGDEFAIFMPDLPDDAAAAELARRLVACLNDALNVNGTSLSAGLSIGIAIFPPNGQSAAELIDAADQAMYRAKRQGGGYAYHTEAVTAQVARQQQMAKDLHFAVREDQLFCMFQPIFDAKTHTPVAVEALVRWRHPELGVMAPGDWLPLAQRSDLLKGFTPTIIDHALRELPAWKKQGWSPTVSINISASECLDSKLPDVIADTLHKYSLKGSDIELEITDDLLSVPAGMDTMNLLRKIGVAMVMDNTSGGYPTLPAIYRLPLNRVKVDLAAIGQLRSAREMELFTAFVALAHRMQMQVIAEGVETEAQSNAVLTADCDFLQGRYYALVQDANLLSRHVQQLKTREPSAAAGRWF